MLLKLFKTTILLMVSFYITATPSYAMQIVAIVGDSVITDYEVSQRARILALLNKINLDDKETLKKIEREIVQALIDEQIKKDYAKRMDINIPKDVIKNVISEYAIKIGKPNIEELKKYVLANNIDWEIFEEAITDEIIWSNIVYGGIAQHIQVTESEIEQRAAMQNIDITNQDNFNQIKQEIIHERLSMYVAKIISQMKRFNIIESVN